MLSQNLTEIIAEAIVNLKVKGQTAQMEELLQGLEEMKNVDEIVKQCQAIQKAWSDYNFLQIALCNESIASKVAVADIASKVAVAEKLLKTALEEQTLKQEEDELLRHSTKRLRTLEDKIEQKQHDEQSNKANCKEDACASVKGGILGGVGLSTTAALLSSELGLSIAAAAGTGFGAGAAMGVIATYLIRKCCKKEGAVEDIEKGHSVTRPYRSFVGSRRDSQPVELSDSGTRSTSSLVAPEVDLRSPLLSEQRPRGYTN